MIDENVVDTENFLVVTGPNDLIDEPWGTVPCPRPLFDDYRRQDVGTLFSIPQRIISGPFLNTLITLHHDIFDLYMATIRSRRNMASFFGIRGTIKLRITFRSAITAYGTGMASWIYGPLRPGNNRTEGQLLRSSSHAVIFDVPSCPELLMEIPYMNNKEFISKFEPNYVTLAIDLLSLDSIDTAIAPTVYTEVWMSMEDVEVTNYIEAQSQQVVLAQREYQLPGRMSLPLAVAAAGTIANVGSSLMTSVVTQGYSDLKKAIYGEVKTMLKDDSNTKTKTKFEDQVDSSQKVSSNIQTPVYSAPYGNMNSLAPTTALQSMTEMPMWKLNPAEFGDVENHRLSDIVQNAVFHSSHTFTANGNALTLDFSYESLKGYAGYISEHFRYARARPRLGMWFTFSPLMSARFQIRVAAFGTAFLTEADSSLALNTLLVKGSSYHILELPYNFSSPVLPCDEVSFSTQITLVSKGEPTTVGNVPPIRVHFFTSMGPDAQFFSVRHPRLTEDPTPEPPPAALLIEAHSSTREMNRAEPDICFTDGPLRQISYMDSVDTVEELCARWTSQLTPLKQVDNSPRVASSEILPAGQEFANAKYGDNPQHFIPLFALWRGSRDFRYSPGSTIPIESRPTMATEGVSYYSSLSIANGGFVIGSDNVVQVRVPYLSRYRTLLGTIAPDDLDTAPLPLTNIELTNTDQVYSRASPDFQLFHLNGLYQGYDSVVYTRPPP